MKITEKEIKTALSENRKMLAVIHKRILGLYDELANTETQIMSISMKSPVYGTIGSAGTDKDLTDIMLKHKRFIAEQAVEIYEEIRKLTEDEERINRIMVCFQALEGREYVILNNLYVKGMPYKTAEAASGVSHRTFEKIRKSGIRRIIQMYEAPLNNLEIISPKQRKKKMPGTEKKKDIISLD